MFLMSLAVSATLANGPDCKLISFSKHRLLRRTSEQVCVTKGKFGEFLLHRTLANAGGVASVTWTSTNNCRGALPQLQALEKLELPQVDLPGFGKDLEVLVLDGADYRLRSPALYSGDRSDLIVRSNVDTPLARWVDQTLAVLAPCWGAKP